MPISGPHRRLIALVQDCVPLVREPYAALADLLGRDEEWVLDQLAELRGPADIIREVSGIFAAAALGYEQALVAMQVPPDRLDRAGQSVAEHPGVSHCYARAGAVNLWFTLATSPASRLGLAGTAGRLAHLAGAEDHMLLPALRRYKLHVRFGGDQEAEEAWPDPAAGPAGVCPAPDAEPARAGPAPGESGRAPSPRRDPERARAAATQLGDEQIRAVRALQLDLPMRRDPFGPIAAAEGLDPDMLLVHGADFLVAGWMRRYAAVLRHQAAGAPCNVLVAWAVDPAVADVAGFRCAQVPAVSHCYLRPARPRWPYTLYTMIHGRGEQDCAAVIDEIAATTGLHRHVRLWTTAEYAKRRVRFFTPAEAAWEAEHQRGCAGVRGAGGTEKTR